MAAARLIARQGRSRSPYRDKRERNVALGLCRVRVCSGYDTPGRRNSPGLGGGGILATGRMPVAGGARRSGFGSVARCKRLRGRHYRLKLKNGLGGG